jgi:hypothetical protein
MTVTPCPCGRAPDPQVVTNPPGLTTISDRVDDFSGFRRALLEPRPGEVALLDWRPVPGDLGLQLLEWWAYLADILTFYTERIANESYLRTAEMPADVSALVALLGYQPRPAIAATGQVAAIRSTARPTEPVAIPAGMPVASTATPGVPTQTFETAAASFAGPSDVPIELPPSTALLQPASSPGDTSLVGSVLLRGNVASLKPGDELLAVPRTWSLAAGDDYWAKLSVVSTASEADPTGTDNTRVTLDAPQRGEVADWMTSASVDDYRLVRLSQTAALWTQTDDPAITIGAESTLTVWLSAAVRGITPGELVFLDADAPGTAVGLVATVREIFTPVPYPVTSGSPPMPEIPVAHTALTLQIPYARWVVDNLSNAVVRFGLTDAGTLIGTAATTLTALPAAVAAPNGFTVPAGGAPAFVEDASGTGIAVTAITGRGGQLILTATPATPAVFSVVAPLRLLVDVVDVSRGTTVVAETLGTGDASLAGQAFVLKQSPLTYLASGAGYVSTLQIAINAILWTEVSSFYDQPADAAVFVVSQLADGTSQVRFGDGLNGARLPTGGQIVASYRYGAGAGSPPPGRLTTILQPQPNLASIRNPVAVWGGADAEPRDGIRKNAPASVLTFGRAISADDYESVAAQAPGVARARAYWTWDAPSQGTLVKVYVGDVPGAAAAASEALAGAEDPNRPVVVTEAVPIQLTVACTVLIAADRVGVGVDVVAAATAALADPTDGLFAAANMPIGQALYSSQIEAALLVDGAEAVYGLTVTSDGIDLFSTEPVGGAEAGEGSYFVLAASHVNPMMVGDG